MRKILILICLFLCSFSMKCYDAKKLQCSNCYDIKSVLKAVNKLAEKALDDKIDNYEIRIDEETDFYIIVYNNIERLNNPLQKGGGGLLIKMSKNDCKIVDYKLFA